MSEGLVVDTSKDTIQALMLHVDAVREDIEPVLKEMETMGHKRVVEKFTHYDNVMRNICGFLYAELYEIEEVKQ